MKNEIIIYQADELSIRLEVRIEEETIWLTQAQIVHLFNSSKANISEHIKNIFSSGELDKTSTVRKIRTVQPEGTRTISRDITHYNLDLIISIGYRVNTIRGTQFRIWANKVLKEYLLKGYVVNQRIDRIENDVHYLKEKVSQFDLQVKTSLPPNEGIFYNGQVFDAYVFVSELIKSAKSSIILIDNYVDETVFSILSKRSGNVNATIYTSKLTKQLKLDQKKHNQQYPAIALKTVTQSHDRFLILDRKIVYHIGASLKDLGKKWFAFSKIGINAKELIDRLE
ncbi:MAG: virulence RhuM family protein [Candidatus Marinimicrobia bacterium]|nr:virulence RhuM family protein [Candidatus Neomarinimicrobiota bacterium]